MTNVQDLQVEITELDLTDEQMNDLLTQPAALLADEAAESDKLAKEIE